MWPSPDTMYISSPTTTGLDETGPEVSTLHRVVTSPSGPVPATSPVRPTLPLYIKKSRPIAAWLVDGLGFPSADDEAVGAGGVVPIVRALPQAPNATAGTRTADANRTSCPARIAEPPEGRGRFDQRRRATMQGTTCGVPISLKAAGAY